MKLKIFKIYNNNLGIAGNILSALEILHYKKKGELLFFDFKNVLYSNKINTWDKFFYQPFYEFNDLIEKKINNKDFEIEYYSAKKFYRFNYFNNNNKQFYDTKFIEPLKNKFKKYIRFKNNIIDKYKVFIKKNLSRNTLSLHLRGGDRFQVRPWNKLKLNNNIDENKKHYKNYNKLLNFRRYENFLKKILQTKKFNKIFLATDDWYYFNNVKKKFKTLLLPNYSTIKNKYRFDIFKNKQELGIHQLNVYADEETKTKLGEEAIIDAVIMSKCKYSILSKSNISLLTILLRDDYNFEFIDDHIKYF
jgi:hypothetical protein